MFGVIAKHSQDWSQECLGIRYRHTFGCLMILLSLGDHWSVFISGSQLTPFSPQSGIPKLRSPKWAFHALLIHLSHLQSQRPARLLVAQCSFPLNAVAELALTSALECGPSQLVDGQSGASRYVSQSSLPRPTDTSRHKLSTIRRSNRGRLLRGISRPLEKV